MLNVRSFHDRFGLRRQSASVDGALTALRAPIRTSVRPTCLLSESGVALRFPPRCSMNPGRSIACRTLCIIVTIPLLRLATLAP